MKPGSLRRGQCCSYRKKLLSDKQNQIPVHLVCWLPLLWTLIFNPAGFKAGEKMTYHLKATFPFSGILTLENISSNISTFHISRDLHIFFHCSMSNVRLNFISARKEIRKKKVLTHWKRSLIPYHFIPYKRRKGTKIMDHSSLFPSIYQNLIYSEDY